MVFQPSKQIILIGSLGRNSGKTSMTLELIRLWKDKFPVTAVKITSVDRENGNCPRGGNGCGACTGFSENYLLEEMKDCYADKDTDKFLRAGAQKVFWLRAFRTSLQEAFNVFLKNVLADSLVFCESNSLAQILRPACFIMLAHNVDYPGKHSAQGLITQADILLQGCYTVSDITRIAVQIKIGRTSKGQPLVYSPE